MLKLKLLLLILFLVGCGITSTPDFKTSRLVSLNTSLDTSFGNNGTSLIKFRNNLENEYIDLLLESNGDMVVLGHTATRPCLLICVFQKAEENSFVARFSSTGQLDATFGKSGFLLVPGEFPTSIRLFRHNDGFLVISMNKQYLNGSVAETIVQFTAISSVGKIDTSFGDNGIIRNVIEDSDWHDSFLERAYLHTDGNFYLTALAYRENVSSALVISRFSRNGKFDESFGENGVLEYTQDVDDYDFDSLGRLLIFSNNGKNIQRYFPSGELDTSFADDGELQVENTNASDSIIAIQSGVDILLTYVNCIDVEGCETVTQRIKESGKLDASFGDSGDIVTPHSRYFTSSSREIDGHFVFEDEIYRKIDKQHYNYGSDGTSRKLVGQEGSLDLDISSGEDGILYESITGFFKQPDGKVLMIGSVGQENALLARFNLE